MGFLMGFKMKAKELIEFLQTQDPEAEVLTHSIEYGAQPLIGAADGDELESVQRWRRKTGDLRSLVLLKTD